MENKTIIDDLKEFVTFEAKLKESQTHSTLNELMKEEEVVKFFEREKIKKDIGDLINRIGEDLIKIENKIIQLSDGNEIVFHKITKDELGDNFKHSISDDYQYRCWSSYGYGNYYLLFKKERDELLKPISVQTYAGS